MTTSYMLTLELQQMLCEHSGATQPCADGVPFTVAIGRN
jgi:hypothetical protein